MKDEHIMLLYLEPRQKVRCLNNNKNEVEVCQTSRNYKCFSFRNQ